MPNTPRSFVACTPTDPVPLALTDAFSAIRSSACITPVPVRLSFASSHLPEIISVPLPSRIVPFTSFASMCRTIRRPLPSSLASNLGDSLTESTRRVESPEFSILVRNLEHTLSLGRSCVLIFSSESCIVSLPPLLVNIKADARSDGQSKNALPAESASQV